MRNILIITEFYYPGSKGGGPIKSVQNIVNNLKKRFNFFIITSDRDLGDSKPYKNIKTNVWTKGNFGEKIFYTDISKINNNEIRKLVNEINVYKIYLNSFFNYKYSIKIVKLFDKEKLIIAPRGEFYEGALENKFAKKKLYLLFSKIVKRYKNITWHSTSMKESMQINNYFKSSLIHRIPNLVKNERFSIKDKTIKEPNKLNLVYISRITRKKNLDYAIDIISNKRNVKLFIYGNIEDEIYWNEILMKAKKQEVDIKYLGNLESNEVTKTFKKYDFFIFPTGGENFGHVIFESLSSGCPVIISDQTPWKNLEDENAGWSIKLDNMVRFNEVIDKCLTMSQNEYKQMAINAYDYSVKYTENDKNITKMINMFNE